MVEGPGKVVVGIAVAAAVLGGFWLWWSSVPAAAEPIPRPGAGESLASGAADANRAGPAQEQGATPVLPDSRSQAPAPPPHAVLVPVSSLPAEQKDLFDYFNRILVRAGKAPVPKDASISQSDLEAFVQLATDSKGRVHAAEFRWRVAVDKRASAAAKEIGAALREGRIPPYPVLPPGAGLPTAKHPYDMLSLHRPAGSTERYLIELPEQVCANEAQAFREARESQATFFEETLRPLFRVPERTKG